MKNLKIAFLSAALLFSSAAFAAVAPEGNGAVNTASFSAPEGNGNVNIAVLAPEGNGAVNTAALEPKGRGLA